MSRVITLDEILAFRPCWAKPATVVEAKECPCYVCGQTLTFNRVLTPKEAFLATAERFGLTDYLDKEASEWNLDDVFYALRALGRSGSVAWLEARFP